MEIAFFFFALVVVGAIIGTLNRDAHRNSNKDIKSQARTNSSKLRSAERGIHADPDAAHGVPIQRNIPKELKGKCHVIDGDTIVIGRTHIRLAGIDAPELDQPWGQASKWEMVRICKGQTITAVTNGEVSHNRLVATCYLPDGRDIGAELIKAGLALDWRFFSGGKYRALEKQGVRQKFFWARKNASSLARQ